MGHVEEQHLEYSPLHLPFMLNLSMSAWCEGDFRRVKSTIYCAMAYGPEVIQQRLHYHLLVIRDALRIYSINSAFPLDVQAITLLQRTVKLSFSPTSL